MKKKKIWKIVSTLSQKTAPPGFSVFESVVLFVLLPLNWEWFKVTYEFCMNNSQTILQYTKKEAVFISVDMNIALPHRGKQFMKLHL